MDAYDGYRTKDAWGLFDSFRATRLLGSLIAMNAKIGVVSNKTAYRFHPK